MTVLKESTPQGPGGSQKSRQKVSIVWATAGNSEGTRGVCTNSVSAALKHPNVPGGAANVCLPWQY